MRLPALLLAGGMGKRLGFNGEKPLLDFEGKPMLDWVLDALLGAENISRVAVAVTQNTPRTTEHIKHKDEFRGGKITMAKTPGTGYVEDMLSAFGQLGMRRALVASSDMPLLAPDDVDYVAEEYRARGSRGSMTVLVPLSLVAELGFTPNYPMGEFSATGINVVDLDDGKEFSLVTQKIRFAANINFQSDVEAARRLHKI